MAKQRGLVVVEGSSGLTASQMEEFWRRVRLPEGKKGRITGTNFQVFLDKPDGFAGQTETLALVEEMPVHQNGYPDLSKILLDHQAKFWDRVAGVTFADADLVLPVYRLGFHWPILCPPTWLHQQLFDLARDLKIHNCWSYLDDLSVLEVKEDHLKVVRLSSFGPRLSQTRGCRTTM